MKVSITIRGPQVHPAQRSRRRSALHRRLRRREDGRDRVARREPRRLLPRHARGAEHRVGVRALSARGATRSLQASSTRSSRSAGMLLEAALPAGCKRRGRMSLAVVSLGVVVSLVLGGVLRARGALGARHGRARHAHPARSRHTAASCSPPVRRARCAARRRASALMAHLRPLEALVNQPFAALLFVPHAAGVRGGRVRSGGPAGAVGAGSPAGPGRGRPTLALAFLGLMCARLGLQDLADVGVPERPPVDRIVTGSVAVLS